MKTKIQLFIIAAIILFTGARIHAQWVTFPVVFHVLYVNNTQNLHDSILQHQVDVLNEDFNAANPDIVNVPPVWQPIIGNMNISFVFASIDPNGNPTNGIERRQVASFSSLNAHSTAAGGLDAWPDTSYLNIWVWQLPNGMLGYSAFPDTNSTTPTGLDLTWYVVGRGAYAMEPYNRGRVATHELAHWFGLRHIWGDASGCLTDDGIADTPVQDQETFGYHAPGTILTDLCQPVAPGKMWMNFLDFTDDSAMCMFTLGQCVEMTNVINTMRMGFLTPDGIDGIGEHSAYSKYAVFPSPSADGLFTINRNDVSATAVVEVYDVQGRLLGAPQPFTAGATSMQLNLTAYADGVYTIVIRGNAVETKRVVIAHQ